MIAGDFLIKASRELQEAGVATARLDTLVLMEDALGCSRAQLLAHPEDELPAAAQAALERQLERRARHEPLAYIRGHSEFYGRPFYVDKHVLVPRPESETIIELLKELGIKSDEWIIDVGTGSGALAVTAACELGHKKVMAIDIDLECLQAAKHNAQTHGVTIDIRQGDLLSPLLKSDQKIKISALLCNLPYVPDDYPINEAARHEPGLALFGGNDGLDLYRQLFAQISRLPTSSQPRYVITESLPGQHVALITLAESYHYSQTQHVDFIQILQSI